MLGAAAVCAYQGGVAELLFGSCPAMSDVGTVSWYNPLAALNYLKVMGKLTTVVAGLGCTVWDLVPLMADVHTASHMRAARLSKQQGMHVRPI